VAEGRTRWVIRKDRIAETLGSLLGATSCQQELDYSSRNSQEKFKEDDPRKKEGVQMMAISRCALWPDVGMASTESDPCTLGPKYANPMTLSRN
jgi:hypothetical protein